MRLTLVSFHMNDCFCEFDADSKGLQRCKQIPSVLQGYRIHALRYPPFVGSAKRAFCKGGERPTTKPVAAAMVEEFINCERKPKRIPSRSGNRS